MDEDIKTFLIGAYEALQRHEKQILELKISVQAAVHALKQKDKEFAAAFGEQQRDIARGLNSMPAQTRSSYDAIIAQLRKL